MSVHVLSRARMPHVSRTVEVRTALKSYPFSFNGIEYQLTEAVEVLVKSDVGDSGGYTAEFTRGSRKYKVPNVFSYPMSTPETAINCLFMATMRHRKDILPTEIVRGTPAMTPKHH